MVTCAGHARNLSQLKQVPCNTYRISRVETLGCPVVKLSKKNPFSFSLYIARKTKLKTNQDHIAKQNSQKAEHKNQINRIWPVAQRPTKLH
jgi:hypothetical protein